MNYVSLLNMSYVKNERIINMGDIQVNKKFLKILLNTNKYTYKTEDVLKTYIKDFLTDANGYVEQSYLRYYAYYNVVEDTLSENCNFKENDYTRVLEDIKIKFIAKIFVSFDLSENSINYKTLDSATNAFYESIISVRNSFEVDVYTTIRNSFFERDENGMISRASIVFV